MSLPVESALSTQTTRSFVGSPGSASLHEPTAPVCTVTMRSQQAPGLVDHQATSSDHPPSPCIASIGSNVSNAWTPRQVLHPLYVSLYDSQHPPYHRRRIPFDCGCDVHCGHPHGG
eukprot:3900024-Pyramimonas_sp.AAC.1